VAFDAITAGRVCWVCLLREQELVR